jgi:hypothetical protein
MNHFRLLPSLIAHTHPRDFCRGRRQALKAIGLTALTAPWAGPLAAPALQAADALSPLNRFPRMIQEYFVQQ